MWEAPEHDQYADEIFLAGELAPAGTYQQIGTCRKVQLQHEDFLPTSLDGRVACYHRVSIPWSDIQREYQAQEQDAA
jgi:hypothetical protein